MSKQNKPPPLELPLHKGSEGHLTIGFYALVVTNHLEDQKS